MVSQSCNILDWDINLDFCILEAKLFVAALEACFHFGLFPFEMFLQHSLFVVFSSKCTLQKDIKVLAGEENILNVIKPNPFRFLSRLKASG